MKKIDVCPYNCTEDGKEKPYHIKESLLIILFNPDLRIQAMDLLKRDDLARKIEKQKGDWLLLEDAEYEMILVSMNAVKGYTRNDVEFVKRIMDAEDAQVKEVAM